MCLNETQFDEWTTKDGKSKHYIRALFCFQGGGSGGREGRGHEKCKIEMSLSFVNSVNAIYI